MKTNLVYVLHGRSLTSSEWLGNWNHQIRIGPGVICLQKYGRKVELPTNYEQGWSGTISIYELDRDTSTGTMKLDLCYKNVVGLIRKPSNGITYVYMGQNYAASDANTHHPIFARDSSRGTLSGRKVIVMLDVYRTGENSEDPAGGNVRYDLSGELAISEAEILEPVAEEVE